MESFALITVITTIALLLTHYLILDPLCINPLGRVPGPKSFALSKWRLAYEDWKGTRTRSIHRLHQLYGPVVRVSPKEISFNSLTALRAIYGPGSGYGRTNFYRMFDAYGRQNLFTFHSAKQHGDRKKLLSHAYSKSVILKEPVASVLEEKVREYLALIESEPERTSEIFSTLHYYALDNITEFLYGTYGATSAMSGSQVHRTLIHDILDPARRRLSWFATHLPRLTAWLYSQIGLMENMTKPFLPMQKPATYTGIRGFALQTFRKFSADMADKGRHQNLHNDGGTSIISRLWKDHCSVKSGGLSDLDIASECADHLLAGIDTTSDSLMFLIWALSLPENSKYQEKLIQEISRLPDDCLNEQGYPTVGGSDRCVYLHAVIKETLRLYAPLPATEPRCLNIDSVIDGFKIPAGTTVGMFPYAMHRNPTVFTDPLVFDPERWLGPGVSEMNRWWWAFSSGGRMCIGMHLAMAEMTTLTATIYQRYRTTIASGFEGITPGVTSRFEVFQDDLFSKMEEHTCYIKFEPR